MSSLSLSSSGDFDVASSSMKVTRLLRLLVKRLISKPLLRFTSSSETSENYEDGLQQYCLRLLTSRLYPEIEHDHFFVTQMISKSLLSNNNNNNSMLRFEELNTKLMSHDVLKNKWAILYLLHQLSQPSSASSQSSINLPLGQAFSVVDEIRPTKRISRVTFNESTNATTTGGGGGGNASASTTTTTTTVTTRKKPSKTQQHRNELRKYTRSHIPESVLVRDIIYTFQGAEGRYVRFDENEDAYKVVDGAVSKPTRHLIRRICELGWMYRNINNYITNTLSLSSVSLTEQSFCGALQEEFTKYYRLVAVLETQIAEDNYMASSASSFDSDVIDYGDTNDVNEAGKFTLRRLFVWIQEPLQRLKLMAMLVDASKGTKGGALATAIGSFLGHGDPFIHTFVSSLMRKLRKPIYVMIAKWITSGELVDPFNEFFIAVDNKIDAEQLWTHKYRLRKEMIPSFIDTKLAQKILVTGKSINFLRHCCKESEWVVESELTMGEDLEYGRDIELEQAVDEAARVTNKQLLFCMMERFKFRDHCLALKKYLLLGQGDFIQHLMGQLYTDLSKKAVELYHHNLKTMLQSSIRASNAQYEDEDTLSRLCIRLLSDGEGKCGWDVFSLDYATNAPISVVFNRKAMSRYLRVFNFLWRLKRVEMSLTKTWGRNDANKILKLKDSYLLMCVQRGYFLRNEMNHIIRNLHNYMMFEVLECAWTDFLSDMELATNLDELIAAHDKYLQAIVTKSLMGNPKTTHHPIIGILLQLFDIVIHFSFLQVQLFRNVEAETLRRKHVEHKANERTENDQWGVVGDEENEYERATSEVKKIADRYYKQLRSLEKKFHNSVRAMFEEMSKTQSTQSDVRFLKLRLDFNEFYSGRGVSSLSKQ